MISSFDGYRLGSIVFHYTLEKRDGTMFWNCENRLVCINLVVLSVAILRLFSM